MADGDYERRTAHDAEMKRFERMIRESRKRAAEGKGSDRFSGSKAEAGR